VAVCVTRAFSRALVILLALALFLEAVSVTGASFLVGAHALPAMGAAFI